MGRLPAGQTPRLYTEETSEGFWIHPAAGYRRFLAKEMAMAEPAEYGLAYIAQFRSVDELWTDLARQPFFVASAERASRAAAFDAHYPGGRADLVRRADSAVRHEFDLLGSGPRQLGARLPWHTDFKTGREWPLAYCADIEYNELDRPSDVKVPWELSRCQHFTRLGQAYWLTGDERYGSEFVAETTDWIAANPFSQGVNWACAMDVGLRAVSWIWGFHFFADAQACADAAFRLRFLRALFLHGEFIVRHLEKADLNGNHYLCDGVGLVFLAREGYQLSSKAFEEGARLNPYYRDGLFNLVNTYLVLNDSAKMLPAAQRLVSIDPMNRQSLRLLAFAHLFL